MDKHSHSLLFCLAFKYIHIFKRASLHTLYLAEMYNNNNNQQQKGISSRNLTDLFFML